MPLQGEVAGGGTTPPPLAPRGKGGARRHDRPALMPVRQADAGPVRARAAPGTGRGGARRYDRPTPAPRAGRWDREEELLPRAPQGPRSESGGEERSDPHRSPFRGGSGGERPDMGAWAGLHLASRRPPAGAGPVVLHIYPWHKGFSVTRALARTCMCALEDSPVFIWWRRRQIRKKCT